MELLSKIIKHVLNWLIGDVSKPPTTEPDQPTDYRGQLLVAHNEQRLSASVAPVKLNDKLNTAALAHATWMAENDRLTHLNNLSSRVIDVGYAYVLIGENIAMGYATVDAVMTGWMNSTGHRRNILNSGYKDVGFGKVVLNGRAWWCTIFGQSRSAANATEDVSIECAGGIIDSLVSAELAVERSVQRTLAKKPAKRTRKTKQKSRTK